MRIHMVSGTEIGIRKNHEMYKQTKIKKDFLMEVRKSFLFFLGVKKEVSLCKDETE